MTTTNTPSPHSTTRRIDDEEMHFDSHELRVPGVTVTHIIPDNRDPYTAVYLHGVTSFHTNRFGWTVRTPRGSTRIHLIGTPWPAPDPADALSFDECEAAGLDGTLRTIGAQR